MKKITLILFLIQILIGCKSNYAKEIVGKWLCISNFNNQTYEFRADHSYVFRLNEYITFSGTYKFTPESDSLILYDGNNQVLISYIYKLNDNYLFLLNYKVHHQIDEISLLKRENDISTKNEIKDNEEITTIIFSKKHIGLVYLNYDKKTGENVVLDEERNPVIKIPINGLLSIKLEANPFNYVLGKFNFVEKTIENVDKKLPYFFFTENIGNLDKLLNNGYKLDSIYVCLYGYNQISREELNEKFNRSIDGDVLMFKVDTLKNLLVNPFHKTDLRPEKK